MKKYLIGFLILVLLVPVLRAEISKTDIETKLVESLKQIRSTSLSARTSLTSLNSRMFDIGATFGGSIEAKDQTSLGKLPAKVQEAIDSLNEVINLIDSDYPSIQG